MAIRDSSRGERRAGEGSHRNQKAPVCLASPADTASCATAVSHANYSVYPPLPSEEASPARGRGLRGRVGTRGRPTPFIIFTVSGPLRLLFSIHPASLKLLKFERRDFSTPRCTPTNHLAAPSGKGSTHMRTRSPHPGLPARPQGRDPRWPLPERHMGRRPQEGGHIRSQNPPTSFLEGIQRLPAPPNSA